MKGTARSCGLSPIIEQSLPEAASLAVTARWLLYYVGNSEGHICYYTANY